MSRFAALLFSLLLVTAPLSALAGDGDASASGAAADIQSYISAITGDSDENPHSCYETDDDTQERPDLANRPQS
tara:strand:- start:2533 stop:2754 length:222 start_codon:yes stop_codon:yes gene_type:complete